MYTENDFGRRRSRGRDTRHHTIDPLHRCPYRDFYSGANSIDFESLPSPRKLAVMAPITPLSGFVLRNSAPVFRSSSRLT